MVMYNVTKNNVSINFFYYNIKQTNETQQGFL